MGDYTPLPMPSTRDDDVRWVLGELPWLLLGVVLVLVSVWFVETVAEFVLDVFEAVFMRGLGLPLSYEFVGLLHDLVRLGASVVRWTGLLALAGYVVRRATA